MVGCTDCWHEIIIIICIKDEAVRSGSSESRKQSWNDRFLNITFAISQIFFFLHEQFIVFKFFLFLSVKIPISCFKIYIYFIEKNECENPLLPAAGQSSLSLPSSSLGLPARNLVMPSFYVYKKKKIESKSINQS